VSRSSSTLSQSAEAAANGAAPTPSAPAISLRGVSKSFDAVGDLAPYTAIAAVDLEVAAGEFVALVGPSGCGKTTLLGCVSGLVEPSAGSVSVFGEPLAGLNRRATYMFQADPLLPWKTTLENAILGLALRGESKRRARELGLEWLHRVGLGEFGDHYPHQLSGGMRRRVAIAQTWIVDPDILLMDEPFSALDIQMRQAMEEELMELWTGSGKSVVFVTHDLDEAIALADRVVVLSAGPAARPIGEHRVQLPRPRSIMDLRATPEFVEIFERIWHQLRSEVEKSLARSPEAKR
jgi:NitT/TauT family transport system ATP-binding protein